MIESDRSEGGTATGNAKPAGEQPAHPGAVQAGGESGDKETAEGEGAGVENHGSRVTGHGGRQLDGGGSVLGGDFQEHGPTADEDEEGEDDPEPRALFHDGVECGERIGDQSRA